MSVIIIGIVQVLATGGGSVLVDRAGRKKLLIISAAVMALSIGNVIFFVIFCFLVVYVIFVFFIIRFRYFL